MTTARFYQHGVKAYVEGRPLSLNPHNPLNCAGAHEGWKDGWLDASHAHWRKLSLELAKAQRTIQIDRLIAARECSQAQLAAH